MMFSHQNLRDQFPMLRRRIDGHPLHYLDNAATTFSPQCVLDAVQAYETQYRANVSRGVYTLAAEATAAYEAARERVAHYLGGVDTDEVVFTAGTTAGINLLAYGLGQALGEGDEVVVSLAEHHSNFLPWQLQCERSGAQLRVIGVHDDGRLDLDDLESLITERCRVVAVTQASNVTGAVTDLAPLADAARAVGALLVVDGAQGVPHGPVDVAALGADFYAFSGHKAFAPTGVGVLWGRAEAFDRLPPFMVGGGMVERVAVEESHYLPGAQRFEAGTPPIAQAIGLGAALAWLSELPWNELHQRERRLSERLLAGLGAMPGLRLIGPADTEARLPIVSFDIEGCHPHDICQLLDTRGVALRGGHHCAHPLQRHFGLVATSRASLALFNDEDDVDALLTGLADVCEQLR